MSPTTLPLPWQPPALSADFKSMPEDFIVTEMLDIEHSGSGEHLWLHITKINLNTAYVAKLLADWAGVPARDVGYSGLKDRHAVTHQWFSIRLPSQTMPDISLENFIKAHLKDGESFIPNKLTWHNRKLNRGTHKYNHFAIRLRHLKGDIGAIDEMLKRIKSGGVPNYFGEQRFGIEGKNLDKAYSFFEKQLMSNKPYRPNKKLAEKDGLMISAARSALFNALLGKRVADGTWNQALLGDVFNLEGTGSIFQDALTEEVKSRVKQCDIHPTAPLTGIGDRRDRDAARALYDTLLDDDRYQTLCQGLIKIGAKLAYRPLRLMVHDLTWERSGDDLCLEFRLPKGTFATVVIRMIVQEYHSKHT
ncbi:tRNA pseudouridine(13) synthase TruD [Moraxella catarrhalis]|uniref:tRNA pseudouridine synthase D n=1 Tax=Moraxella catarrhalis TaxID=480 RepID=A0A198UJE8_MORCA|nr:tRNA pseudouridine(13) synthase TruD [Moraxella catarrhalis]OAU95032.1 tRNA pseudouridine 13 synthase [Moraxella catarrhalis]OAU95362.1 tRNA pseudouridine 13 synthase [Moraxella catarrhalis]OAU98256.1 tRNA pseudouridine 13 synthase [Moraxella catarrhalis]